MLLAQEASWPAPCAVTAAAAAAAAEHQQVSTGPPLQSWRLQQHRPTCLPLPASENGGVATAWVAAFALGLVGLVRPSSTQPGKQRSAGQSQQHHRSRAAHHEARRGAGRQQKRFLGATVAGDSHIHSRACCPLGTFSVCSLLVMHATGDGEEDEEIEYRQATPRERQFGYGGGSSRRSAGGGGGRPVSLPLSQLHIMAAQRQLPLLLEGDKVDLSGIISAWSDLLQACQEQAPVLLRYWDTGIGPLLRLAVALPRETWLRSPSDPWVQNVHTPDTQMLSSTKIQELEEYDEGPGLGAEALPFLQALVQHLLCKYPVSGMVAGGFIWNDGAGGVLRERPGREVVLCSGIGLQICLRFVRLYGALALGKEKPLALAKDLLSPMLTKKMVRNLVAGNADFPPQTPVEMPDDVRHMQPASVTLAGPLAALRIAQVTALGGSEELGRSIVQGTKLGKDLGTPEEEEFAETVMSWAVRFADALELAEERDMSLALEWLLSQRQVDPNFSVIIAGNPRSPKKVLDVSKFAAASLDLQRLQTSGQRFLPNPAGIKGFVKTGQLVAFGSPFEGVQQLVLGAFTGDLGVPNSWHGDEYERSAIEEEFITKNLRRATVRIDEIMSFEYLQHVGQTMRNCLRVERRGGQSLMKYLARVRSRDSSFWVMTITAEDDGDDKQGQAADAPEQHMLLMEVYNEMRIIHHAEGPHPRRWPRPDAWKWLREWAEQENLVPDGPEGVTVGPYEGYRGYLDAWDIRRCFLW